MSQAQIKVSFLLPSHAADWAGQALYTFFPDGLLSGPVKNSLTPFSGWPKRRDPKNLEDLKSTLLRFGASRIRIQPERERDWVREYKSRFPVQSLGKFVILPEWRKRAKIPAGKFPIVLLQGQAFGTGLHPSTRLMLKAIEGTRANYALDIGAGSGILSFAALHMGAEKVLAVELEDAACDEMRDNAKLNGFGHARFIVRCGIFPRLLKGRKLGVGLLLANIVTPVLCALMRAMAQQTRKGGTLLFSGIHTQAEAKKVAASARAAGLNIVSRTSKGDWFCLRALK